MSKVVTGGREVAVVTSPRPEEIRRQLQVILNSPAFHGSKRCQQFLEYVCERSLAGEAATLKERTIAIEVFGRQPQSDLGEDTIVRVGAREVRKRLAQFYVTPEGVASEIRIELHPGAYAPDFNYCAPSTEETAALPPAPVSTVIPTVDHDFPLMRRKFIVVALAAAAVSTLALLTFLKFSAGNPNNEAFKRFWDPVLRAPEPMLVAVAHPIVYHASWHAMKLSEASQPPRETEAQRAIQVPPKELDGSDMIPVFNQYVGFGDMVAANEVSTMLTGRSKPSRLRLASGVVFEDLRKTPTLLIGAVTNRWTMELQQGWRFRFKYTPEMKTVIADTQGERQEWAIPAKEDGSAPEDYMLVCRIRNSFTGGTLMVAAGLKQFGTEAAGRLLADPEQLGVILRQLPARWESGNLQLVLHARVIGNTPAQPEVVASHLW
ncbi:MAG TPA: hypothetical protein VKU19_33345 [Bryobacteraceae bacterium]|nr:hypothetical protein [Bryobacteraceae bacterium]